MSEWTTTTVGEIADIFDGPHATPAKTEDGPWFLSISSLDRGRLNLAESAHVSEEDFVKWTRRVTPRAGDLLFSYETRLGDAALMPSGIRACLGRRMGILRPRRAVVDPRFLLYAYLGPSFQKTIRERSVRGATVDRIPLTELGEWPISIPSLNEQTAIAQVLGALDNKIALNERIAVTSRALGMARFRKAVAESDIREVRLSDLAVNISRGVAPKYADCADALLIINQKCVRGGRVNINPARKTLREKVRDSKFLQPNDVLVNSTGVGTLGRVARWTHTIEATADSHVTIVRFDSTKVDPVCAGFAMLSAESDIEALGEGSTGQTELSRKRLGEFQLTVPSNDVMRRLRPELDALEARGDAALAESTTLSELRDTLLPKLMSGEIRVRDAERAVEEAT